MFFLHAGETEVGGFGVCGPDDPLYVRDFVTVEQIVSAASVEFLDAAVADYFDRCVDAGLRPDRFARIWCHTHPADSPEPSSTDEQTFARVFGGCDWAVMFIVSRTQRTYARLSFAAGPGGEVLLDVAVDWESWPQLVLKHPEHLQNHVPTWVREYEQNIHLASAMMHGGGLSDMGDWQGWWDSDEYEPRPDAAEPRAPRLTEGKVPA